MAAAAGGESAGGLSTTLLLDVVMRSGPLPHTHTGDRQAVAAAQPQLQ